MNPSNSSSSSTTNSDSETDNNNSDSDDSDNEMLRVAQPEEFHGLRTEDAKDWLDNFNNVADANRWNANRRLAIVPVFLKGAAAR